MLLTSKQTCEMLNIHYQTLMYHLPRNHFKTAKKIGRDWLFESYEILELREKQLKKQQKKSPKNTKTP